MEDNKVLEIFDDIFEKYPKIELDEDLDTIYGRCLPKIFVDKKSESIIKQVNQILKTKNPSTLEELHTLVYCGAQTVIKLYQEAKFPVYYQKDIPNEFPSDEESQKNLLRMSPKRFRRLLLPKIKEEGVSSLSSSFVKLTGNPKTPTIGEIEDFWSKRWDEENSTHYEERESKRRRFVEMEVERMGPKVAPCGTKITEEDLRRALKAKQNWSTPGVDGIQTFWYKKFKSLHKILVQKINSIINQEEEMPKFLTQGFTELHPKNEETDKASNYRPITHLPAIYKIITRCIYEKIFDHFEALGVLADEQCGGRRGYYGVKKALVMDSVFLEHEPVWGCYVDYQKAFDMVPHSWILEMLLVYGVDPVLVEFIKRAMGNWKTRVFLTLGESPVLSRNLFFRRGIFQGDSLSVLFFWTAINPLSFALHQKENMGLKIEDRFVSHVLYMDDLKLYSSDFDGLKNLFRVVEEFSDAISMKLNYEKTKMFSIPYVEKEDRQPLDDDGKIEYIEKGSEVRYLGYKQGLKINHEVTIEKKVLSFGEKIELIEKCQVSEKDKNSIKQVLGHSLCRSFGILHWKQFEGGLTQLTFNKKNFLEIVIKQGKDLPDIYLKMLDILCKMRRDIDRQKEQSTLMQIIVENDNNITPLNLLLDEKKFMARVSKKGPQRKKRKNDQEDDEASKK